MVTSKQFTLVAVQTAIFTPNHSEFAAGKSIGAILRKFPDRFQGEMQALPMPEEVPPEIPRAVLQSSDKTLKVEAGPARMNCHWSRPKDGESPDLSTVVARCCEVQEQYVREMSVRIGRLGLVLT